MDNHLFDHKLSLLTGCALLMVAASCDGVMGGLYDEPQDVEGDLHPGTLVVNATSWADWYYVDFDSIAAVAATGNAEALQRAQTEFKVWPIPDDKQGNVEQRPDGEEAAGIYTYWFDVFDKGLANNHFQAFRPTAAQPEPLHWQLAIHRDNVRTNGGAAIKTQLTDFDALPDDTATLLAGLAADGEKMEWTADTWTETDVWTDRSQMLSELIGSQGIRINQVLSSWMSFVMPPVPPASTHDGHIYLLRLADGRIVALQLTNYMNDAGVKCWLTIRYKMLK